MYGRLRGSSYRIFIYSNTTVCLYSLFVVYVYYSVCTPKFARDSNRLLFRKGKYRRSGFISNICGSITNISKHSRLFFWQHKKGEYLEKTIQNNNFTQVFINSQGTWVIF